MDFVFTFLEGIASFISPCLLPMLPIYISYFAGDDKNNLKKKVINSIGFVLGFTTIFITLAVFASGFGALINSNKSKGIKSEIKNLNFIKSFIFGVMFSISWTPCIGMFLSSALLLIAKHSDMLKGILLMLTYSLGLAIPFILSVFLIEALKNAFNTIKKHYKIVKIISGIILIAMGVYTIFW